MSEPLNPRYSFIAITLHWLIAAAIIFMILLGWWMTDQPDGALKFQRFQLHKSIGITILALSIARVIWRLMNPPPPEPPMPALQAGIAKFVHVAFYVLIIVMPLSGWIMVSASPTGIGTRLYEDFPWFNHIGAPRMERGVPWPHLPGLAELPADTKKALEKPLEFVHSKLAWVIIVLLGLHVAGALKHQFMDKDRLIARMWPGLFGRTAAPVVQGRGALWAFGAAALFVVAGAGLAMLGGEPSGAVPPDQAQQVAGPPARSNAPSWTVDPAKSSIAFKTIYMGRPAQGSFKDWTAKIQFDPDKPDAARIHVEVKVGSAATGEPYFDDSLKEGDWFDIVNNPTAVFEVNEGVFKDGPTQFEATGVLTLKKIAFPVRLPFTLKVDGNTATMHGETTLQRLAMGIGRATPASQQADKQKEWVQDDVGLVVDVVATRQ